MLEKKNLFLLFFLNWMLIIGNVYGQEKADNSTVDISEFTATKKVFRLYLPYPSVEAEFRTAKLNTVSFGAGLSLYASMYRVNGGLTNYNFTFLPVINTKFYQYLNVKRRVNKGKRVDKFSANYLFLTGAGEISDLPFIGLGAGYGLNRNIGRYGFWGFDTGLQLVISPVPMFLPIMQFGIGVVFPKANEMYSLKTKKGNKG